MIGKNLPDNSSQPSDEQQVQVTVNVPIVVQNTNDNQVDVRNLAIIEPGQIVDEKSPTQLALFLGATGKLLLWVIQNPEWALKWALTILAIKLFLSEGFTLEALQKIAKPEIKLPVNGLPTAIPPSQTPTLKKSVP